MKKGGGGIIMITRETSGEERRDGKKESERGRERQIHSQTDYWTYIERMGGEAKIPRTWGQEIEREG